MDINSNDLKTMKAKQLRRIIQESIKEVLSEDSNVLVTTKSGTKPVSYKNPTELSKLKQDTNVSSIETTGGQKIKEGDIEEMARIAKGFRLADPEINTDAYQNKRISGISLADIINYFRENPGIEKTQLQTHFGFKRPQIANAIVNGLLDAGVLLKLGAGGAVETPPEPGEDGEPASIQASEPEDMFMGSSENPLSMYFDNEPNNDGSEDFEPETEPEAGEVEAGEAPQGSMSDDDYEAFMKYTDLKARLDATKSNLLKTKRGGKDRTAGDISDEPTSDIDRLTALKQSLEDKISALVASSDYLKKRTGETKPTPIVVDEPEAETEDEPLDEWTINKWQVYAGIKN